MTAPIEIGLVALILAAAVSTALLRDVLASIIAFSAYSLGIAVAWVFLRAPDVGLTEAAVGAGIMTVLFLLTIAKTVRPPGDKITESINYKALAVSAAVVATLTLTLPHLPPVGDATSPVATDDVTRYYLENAYKETGVKNAVTAVLAAYRGFDTLGEAVVVYSAGAGLLVVLHRRVFG